MVDTDKIAFFKNEIKEILDSTNRDEFPEELRVRVESFVRDCAGTANGEMDIDFQESGRGYYAHLHELGNMKKKGLDEYKEYRTKLLSELQAAEKNGALTHQMQVVFEYLNRGDDTD